MKGNVGIFGFPRLIPEVFPGVQITSGMVTHTEPLYKLISVLRKIRHKENTVELTEKVWVGMRVRSNFWKRNAGNCPKKSDYVILISSHMSHKSSACVSISNIFHLAEESCIY